MFRHMIAAFAFLTLVVLAGCGGGTTVTRRPTPTPTPVSLACFGSFVQAQTFQIGSATPAAEQLLVQGPCVPAPTLKSNPPVALAIPSETTAADMHIVLQPYTNDFVAHISTPDTVTLSNCTGTTTLSQSFSLVKTVQSGVVLGETFYAAAPSGLPGSTFDQLAQAVFDQNGPTINSVTNGSYVFNLTAAPHTRVTELVSWDEHFAAGQVTLFAGTAFITGSVYAIPKGVQFASTATPTPTSC